MKTWNFVREFHTPSQIWNSELCWPSRILIFWSTLFCSTPRKTKQAQASFPSHTVVRFALKANELSQRKVLSFILFADYNLHSQTNVHVIGRLDIFILLDKFGTYFKFDVSLKMFFSLYFPIVSFRKRKIIQLSIYFVYKSSQPCLSTASQIND